MASSNRKHNNSQQQFLDQKNLAERDLLNAQNLHNLKKRKRDDEGEGGSGTDVKMDWREMVFGESQLPLGPNEKTDSTLINSLTVTEAMGAQDIAREKNNTYPASVAKTQMDKGKCSVKGLVHAAIHKEQVDGPQGNYTSQQGG